MEEQLLIPDWLNVEFLQATLRNEVKGSNTTITKLDVESAVPKGDHFASCLLRVMVEFSYLDDNNKSITGTRNLIIKSLPSGEMMRRMLAEAGIFNRETRVYVEFLPEMYSLLKQTQGSGIPYLTSRCIYSEPDILVFEDLKSTGYKMADRREGLDIPHCKMALKSLAVFHAMSMALHEKDPKCFMNFGEGFYREERRPILENHLVPGVQYLAAVVERWPGYERFGEKIRRVAETAVDKIIEIVKPRNGSLSVLNHGDFWVNNILFRYSDSGEVANVKFVDFQVSRFSSPGLDLQYFMYLSPSEEVRFQYMDDLLEFYHNELRKSLKILRCDHIEFTLQQLKNEFEEKAFFGLISTFTLLNLVLAHPKDALDMENLTEGNLKLTEMNPMEKGFSGTLFKNQFQKLLLHFENKDLLLLVKEDNPYINQTRNLQAEITDILRHLPINVNDIGTINPRNIRKQRRVTSYNQWSALPGKGCCLQEMEEGERDNIPSSVTSLLNTDLLQSLAFQEERSTAVSIVGHVIERALPEGENYVSLIHRLKLVYTKDDSLQHETLSFIIKSVPQSASMPKVIKFLLERGVFSREIHMYNVTLPALSTFLETLTQKLPWPRSFQCSEKDVLIMEDLNASGYKMVNRRDGLLDLKHCRVALKSLATFHAASLALYYRHPESMENLKEILYVEESREVLEQHACSRLIAQARVVAKSRDLKRFEDKLRRFSERAVDFIIKVMGSKEDSFRVLNHGDCWINNMMFKYDSNTGEIVDMKFVDFQASRFASPVLDLLSFFYASTCEDVRLHHMDHLVQEYHEDLCLTLSALDCDAHVFPLEKLRREMEDKAMYGLYAACTIISAVLVEPDKVVHTKSVKMADEIDERETAYSDPAYQQSLRKVLLHFEKKGVL
ncbi:uncharacterized protein [Periplaneta americana]|uniref:uncharacterized protein n=1 Tax=Periplaneta americana TaxID=6978 RepID=UPI0037E94E5F